MPCPAELRDRLAGMLACASLPVVVGCGADLPAPEAPGAFPASDAVVLLDGDLGEWERVPPLIEDPADAEMAGIDIGTIRALDDPGWLYLAFDLGREVNAQSLPGSLHFLLDADADEGTGGERHGMTGVDLAIEVSHQRRPESDARGLGVMVRAPDERAAGRAVVSYALDVVVAPTFASRRFEMRIGRRGSGDPALPALGERLRLRAVYVERGEVLDETDVAVYATSTPALRPESGADAARRLRRAEGVIRVAQLNVSSGSFRRRPERFARLLAALEPDVLLLDELPSGTGASDLRRFFEQEPLRSLGSWAFALGRGGGRQHAAVAARRLPLRPAEGLADVRYAAGAVDALRATAPAAARALLDAEEKAGLSSAGAWIDVGGREVLFVALDLRSRGHADSPEDLVRVLQASTLRNRIREQLEGEPVVIGGDFNLVGSATPLRLLASRLYAEEVTLEPVPAERLGERSYSTWRDPGQPFGPGRLDFILVPPSLEVVNAFTFATEDLGGALLGSLGLERGLSQQLSDHLVVAADLRLRSP